MSWLCCQGIRRSKRTGSTRNKISTALKYGDLARELFWFASKVRRPLFGSYSFIVPVCRQCYSHIRLFIKCDHICINQAYGTKVEFSAGAKVVNTLPFYAYISKSENPNNFTVESLNKKLKTSAYSVYKSLFNGVLISEFIKCAICLVYANMVTNVCDR